MQQQPRVGPPLDCDKKSDLNRRPASSADVPHFLLPKAKRAEKPPVHDGLMHDLPKGHENA